MSISQQLKDRLHTTYLFSLFREHNLWLRETHAEQIEWYGVFEAAKLANWSANRLFSPTHYEVSELQ